MLATLNPADEIFKKDYVAPPTRKRLRDIETIVLPNELFEDMPKSTSKVKARRLKIVSEAFAAEKANRLKDMQKTIYEEIVAHEERLDDLKQMMKAKKMEISNKINQQEEEKGDDRNKQMTQSHKQGYQVNNRQHHSDGGKPHYTSQMMSAATPKVSPFIIPETPRTELSSGKGTPQKFKSPNS